MEGCEGGGGGGGGGWTSSAAAAAAAGERGGGEEEGCAHPLCFLIGGMDTCEDVMDVYMTKSNKLYFSLNLQTRTKTAPSHRNVVPVSFTFRPSSMSLHGNAITKTDTKTPAFIARTHPYDTALMAV